MTQLVIVIRGSRNGAVARAPASHHCGQGSISEARRHMCSVLSFRLILFLALRAFYGFSGFPSSTKPNTSKFQFDRRSIPWVCHSKFLVIYLFIFTARYCFATSFKQFLYTEVQIYLVQLRTKLSACFDNEYKALFRCSKQY